MLIIGAGRANFRYRLPLAAGCFVFWVFFLQLPTAAILACATVTSAVATFANLDCRCETQYEGEREVGRRNSVQLGNATSAAGSRGRHLEDDGDDDDRKLGGNNLATFPAMTRRLGRKSRRRANKSRTRK